MKKYIPNKPIKVGEPKDWFDYDKDGNITSLDIEGNPVQNDDKWIAARKDANGKQPDGMCIGGSSASVVAGIYPGHETGCLEDTFNSKLALYHELRGEKRVVEKEDAGKEEIFRIGHTFEDAVARVAAEEINKELAKKGLYCVLRNDTAMYMCGAVDEEGNLMFPHAIADLDRLLDIYRLEDNSFVCKYGLEIKTTRLGGTSSPKWIRSEYNPLGVPENYEVQTRHYMGVMNLDGFFIAVQEYSMKPSDLLIRYIPRNLTLEERILRNEEDFVQRAIKGDKPTELEEDPIKRWAAYSEYAEVLEHPVKEEEGFSLPEDANESIKEFMRIKEAIAELDKMKKDLEKDLAACQLSLSTFFSGDGGEWGTCVFDEHRYFVRQERKQAKGTYDIERLKSEDPELAKRVLSETIVVSKVSKTDKTDLLKYFVPGAIKPELETKIKEVDAAGKELKKTRKKAS